jgi:hypothetical protein
VPSTTTTPTPEAIALRPLTFRLPKPGVSDPHFGFSRSFYYSAEKRGWLRLIRIRDEGRERGVTLIPYQAVEAFVRAQMEPQNRG